MHDWLSTGAFIPTSSGADLGLSSFSIDQLLSCWASDTTRLLVAAHDTLLAIAAVKDRPKSTAWILIKAYYAAFYYAHVA
ncbi:hypothetical protein HFN60_24345 [Rhizobium leguminosarum]|uniref:hypothetical protein n=1 Tax=Rhizobium leguminosarum TaxID=384 RepID=UPI001C989020|nr:hypothetical protein [Rhizobium leguminosarum]MBY5818737.1 hypothetical protein [Rhizobium leguminosarum]